MKKYLIASTGALFLIAGAAFAQTTTSDTTSSTTAPAVVAPPQGSLSTTETKSSNDGYGNTMSSKKTTYGSADGTASTMMWDCTAGRFNWYYDVDETLYVIEGDAIIKDTNGVAHRLGAGDTAYFPAGSRAEWHVERYIRKIAFCRTPLPAAQAFFRRGLRRLKRLMGAGSKDAAPAMFRAE